MTAGPAARMQAQSLYIVWYPWHSVQRSEVDVNDYGGRVKVQYPEGFQLRVVHRHSTRIAWLQLQVIFRCRKPAVGQGNSQKLPRNILLLWVCGTSVSVQRVVGHIPEIDF